MMYLAEINYRTSEYMQDGYKDYTATRLVEADSKDEAEQKVKKHYEEKSDSYGTYYSSICVFISDTIR